MPFPLQPIYKDEKGQFRFRENKIIKWLWTNKDKGARLDLNQIVSMDFPEEDLEQLAMLLGSSFDHMAALPYVSNETLSAAHQVAENPTISEEQARLESYRNKMEVLRDAVRTMAPELFAVHPDDLKAQ